MSKFRPYSRRELHRSGRTWLRRHLKIVLVFGAGCAGLLGVETFVLTTTVTRSAWTWWLLGFVQAAVVALFLHVVHTSFLAADAGAIRQLRGAWGEDSTRDELRRAKRRGLIWGSVDSITFQDGDLDHLVLTRRGGFVAIDSKWRHDTRDRTTMAQAARRAQTRAEALARTVLASQRGARHRAKVNSLPVTPLVVLWGAGRDEVPEGAVVDGIEFVGGHRLVSWLAALDGQPVSKQAAGDALNRLERFRSQTWDLTQKH